MGAAEGAGGARPAAPGMACPRPWCGRAVLQYATLAQHAAQVGLAQDEHMVQAFPSHTAEEALVGRVRPRCPDGRAHHRDPTARRDAGEARPVPAVISADQGARALVERRGCPQLLRDPGVGRVARDTDVDDPARAAFDDPAREM